MDRSKRGARILSVVLAAAVLLLTAGTKLGAIRIGTDGADTLVGTNGDDSLDGGGTDLCDGGDGSDFTQAFGGDCEDEISIES